MMTENDECSEARPDHSGCGCGGHLETLSFEDF